MPQIIQSLFAVSTVFAALYAALTGWRFALRLRGERAARRTGLMLNVLRRGLPPVIAGGVIAAGGVALDRAGAGGLGAFIAGGGLAYALHRGLAEMRQDTGMLIALRVGVGLGLTFAYLWVSGQV